MKKYLILSLLIGSLSACHVTSNQNTTPAPESKPNVKLGQQIDEGLQQMGSKLGDGVKSVNEAVRESGQKIGDGVKQQIESGKVQRVLQKAGDEMNEHLKDAAEEIKKTGDEIHKDLTNSKDD